MLLELSITDFAIIERSSIHFVEGLNVLTGETGAGKSILLDALGAVLGQRVSSDMVRSGAKLARIEAIFDVNEDSLPRVRPVVDELGITLEDDGSIIVTREILANGRSSARINGRLVTVATLSAIGTVLVDIHGQSDHLAILKTNEQRSMLDSYAGLGSLRLEVAVHVQRWREIRRRIAELSSDSREREQRLDLLKFQIDEIESAALMPAEDESLQQEREVLQNADRLRQDTMLAMDAISGDDSAAEIPTASSMLRTVEHSLLDLAAIDRNSVSLSERATELVVLAEDLARDLSIYLDSMQLDPQRLEDVEDRLSLIQSLKRKYGSTIAHIVEFAEDAQHDLEQLTGEGFDIESLREEEMLVRAELVEQCLQLSKARRTAAIDLASKVELSIAELRMGRSEFAIEVRHRADPGGLNVGEEVVHADESGIDDIEFLIAPDAGEPLRPLARIASGGETARIMLALKSILSEVDSTPTLVFDEIDVGVGGRSGQVVGEKLWSLTTEHQVIVVTHLPQIAAFANHHLRIAKHERNARIVSTVDEIRDDERIEELAAMLDGTPVNAASRANAEEMVRRSIALQRSPR
ncbi:MAG: DNA repair protein RecN [Thermomicrobiales bacterium]